MSDCGCRIDWDDPANPGRATNSPRIDPCPLHKAAGQMQEALRSVEVLMAWGGKALAPVEADILASVRAALAAAGPEGGQP